MTVLIGRRQILEAGLAAGALALLPRRANAADPLVVATFPGTWNEAHRDVLAPYFRKKTGAEVTQTIALATDQVAKLEASRGKPPFDVAIMDEGPLLDAVKAGVLEKYPVDKSPNYRDLVPAFQDPWGPKISLQVIGIGFNPRKIKERPKSWNDLFNPAYKGRVGLTALNSTLGMAFMVDLARTRGGGESDIEPAFKALKELLPGVGAISANLGAHAALFQQEQIDIAPYNFNFVQTLKEKGVDIEFATLDTGIPAWRTSLHLVKNAVQAMTTGGTLTLQTDENNDGVWVSVADTGGGIPQEQINRIFEPFYTTKKKGSGLGLMIVQRIVRAHNGRIELDSNVGRGTTFRIWLPLHERKPRLLQERTENHG